MVACFENPAGRKGQAHPQDYSVNQPSLSSEFPDNEKSCLRLQMEGVLGKIQLSSGLHSLHCIKGMAVGTESTPLIPASRRWICVNPEPE